MLEVAKLTLTPHYEVRSLTERARLVMEMPEYAARYGLAMPDVDFVGVENGVVMKGENEPDSCGSYLYGG